MIIEAEVGRKQDAHPLAGVTLGIGAWAWGDPFVWGYGRGYGEGDVRDAFEAALAAGVTFFDTAEFYGLGKSERLLGRFMAETGARPLIATKFLPLPWRLTRRQIIAALRGSLKRLGLPQVDLYQIHFPTPLLPVETLAEALAEALDRGLTRAVGVSNFNARQVRQMAAALGRHGVPLASNQVEYSLVRRHIERSGTLQACRELGVAVIAYSPLGMGLLTGKYTPANPPPGARRWYLRRSLAKAAPLVGLLEDIGASSRKTPAQVAINWTICRGTLPIPGAKTAQQAAHNAGAMAWRLSPDALAALDEASRRAGF